MADSRPPLSLLIAVTATGPLSLTIFVPSMPGIQRAFDTDYATVQLTLTLYLVGFAVAQLLYGPLSDRFGRRPVLLAGQGFFLAGSVLCLVAPGIEALIAGRLVQAVGACSGMVVARAIIQDVYRRENAATVLAYVSAAMAAAPMLGPSIGGMLEVWLGWRASFVFIAVLGAVVVAASVFSLHETHKGEAQGATIVDMMVGFGHLLRRPVFCGHAFQVAFTSSVFFAFVGGVPYVMVDLMGRPPSEFGFYFIAVPAMFMTGSFLAGRVSARVGSDRMVTIGTSIALTGAGAELVWNFGDLLIPVTLFGSMAVAALGAGMAQPNGMAGAVAVDPRRAGAAAGLSGFLQMTVSAAVATVVGALLTDSATPVVGVMFASAGLAVASHLVAVRTREEMP
ncbi:MAG: multidrug effflux MFS transporter [Rhodospirillales bacterium]|jgi:DHA1 family bicyclomycin/chloramphenicol resistance-like MFS transporter|nr:multidrug effflux MFS transporter [Rhodospirillales bacterium]MDP6882684.1 multidrug effflux MFS transporter [Rhodospirillales bacterium]